MVLVGVDHSGYFGFDGFEIISICRLVLSVYAVLIGFGRFWTQKTSKNGVFWKKPKFDRSCGVFLTRFGRFGRFRCFFRHTTKFGGFEKTWFKKGDRFFRFFQKKTVSGNFMFLSLRDVRHASPGGPVFDGFFAFYSGLFLDGMSPTSLD